MQCEKIFFVKKPGLLTTFQDAGRTGYQRFGVRVSGAMDQFAMQVANILVGNARHNACLEVTFIGPELEVCTSAPVTLAITGAALEPKVNGKNIPMWQTFRLRKGDILSFGKHQSGVRAYIAVSGEYDIPTIFGSKSTDIQSGFGRELEKSIYISGMLRNDSTFKSIGLKKTVIPTYPKDVTVSIIEGPHSSSFTEEGHTLFFKTLFTIDKSSNRMGYRLNSNHRIPLKQNGEVWSDAVPFGGIQIPPNGHPIILMADRQTTGGYPRIGTVQSTDLQKIAQLIPHGTIHFKKTSVEKAQERAIRQEEFLRKLTIFRQGFL